MGKNSQKIINSLEKYEISLDEYNEALNLIEDEDDKDLFRLWKLSAALKFHSYYGFDKFIDVLNILKVLKKDQEELSTSIDRIKYLNLCEEILKPEYTEEFRKMVDPEWNSKKWNLKENTHIPLLKDVIDISKN